MRRRCSLGYLESYPVVRNGEEDGEERHWRVSQVPKL